MKDEVSILHLRTEWLDPVSLNLEVLGVLAHSGPLAYGSHNGEEVRGGGGVYADVLVEGTIFWLGGMVLLFVEEQGGCVLSQENFHLATSSEESGAVNLESTGYIVDKIVRKSLSLPQ